MKTILCCIDQEPISELLFDVLDDYFEKDCVSMIVCESDDTAFELSKYNKIDYIFILISNVNYKSEELRKFSQFEICHEFIKLLSKKATDKIVLLCNSYYIDKMNEQGYKYVLPLPFSIKELLKVMDRIE